MNKRLIVPVLAFAAVGLTLPLTMGCAKHMQVVVATAAPAPPPPPAPLPAAPEPPPTIALPGELEFDVNEATLRKTAQCAAVLDKLAEILRDNPRITRLRIEGHTDNWGRAKRNQRLSQDRADAVARWLVAHDIDASRLVTVGFGPSRPLVANDTDEHRKMNRRTEFHVQELDGDPTDDASGQSAPSPIAQE